MKAEKLLQWSHQRISFDKLCLTFIILYQNGNQELNFGIYFYYTHTIIVASEMMRCIT